MNKWEMESKVASGFDGILTQGQQEVIDYVEQLQQKVNQLETTCNNLIDYLDKNKLVLQNPNILDFYMEMKELIGGK